MSKRGLTRVLVTGAARGIGFETAKAFGGPGMDLVVTDVDRSALTSAASELERTGSTVHAYTVDVADRQAVDDMARGVFDRLGGIDVLVNNAGIGHQDELADTSLEVWRKLVEVNLFGVLHHVNAFLPSMIQARHGHIVNVSSGQAFFQMPTWGAYAAVKLAVGCYSEILYFELRKHGVHVTTVYPFMVNTGFYDGVKSHVAGGTFTTRMSMKLLPWYSHSPAKVGRMIHRAVMKKRQVETFSVINDLARTARMLPPVANVMSRVQERLLASRG